MRYLAIFVLFFITSFVFSPSDAERKHAPTVKYVVDNEGILTSRQEKILERIIIKHEEKTSNEIVILTTPDHGDLSSLRKYALYYFNERGIGKADKNNGVLVAMERGKRRVEVINGYGIEDILSDKKTQEIIENTIVPYFKKGNYFKGLKKGVEQIINEIK